MVEVVLALELIWQMEPLVTEAADHRRLQTPPSSPSRPDPPRPPLAGRGELGDLVEGIVLVKLDVGKEAERSESLQEGGWSRPC